LTGLTGLTAGVGVSFSSLVLDYAYLPYGDLGNLHQVSLTFRKAMPARVEAAQPAQAEPVAQVAPALAPAPAPVAPLDPIVHAITECGFSCGWADPGVLKVTLFDDKTKFDFDSDTIRPEGRTRLARLAEILNRYPESTIQVDGYSDSRGTEPIKMRMSLLRAQNVARRLQELGVAAPRFESVNGKSDTDPIVSNAVDAGRPTNRRVELLVHRLKTL
jgi:OOP family OmpA-OmpF porin